MDIDLLEVKAVDLADVAKEDAVDVNALVPAPVSVLYMMLLSVA